VFLLNFLKKIAKKFNKNLRGSIFRLIFAVKF